MKEKSEPPDALALITSVKQIARLNIMVRINVECDARERFDIRIILRPRGADQDRFVLTAGRKAQKIVGTILHGY
jgi:hypothetical protein